MTPPSPSPPPPSPPLAHDCASSPCADGAWLTKTGIDCAALRADLDGGKRDYLDAGGRRAGDSCCHFCPPAPPPSSPPPSPPQPSPPPLSPTPPLSPAVRDCTARPQCTDGYWESAHGADCEALRTDLFGGEESYVDAEGRPAGDSCCQFCPSPPPPSLPLPASPPRTPPASPSPPPSPSPPSSPPPSPPSSPPPSPPPPSPSPPPPSLPPPSPSPSPPPPSPSPPPSPNPPRRAAGSWRNTWAEGTRSRSRRAERRVADS